MKKKNSTPHKPLEDYLVKPGEQSPYANLLINLAFKKAFDPGKPTSCENLVNLLNDLLAPQLKRPIKNVWTRNVAKNLSGSNVSRTAIFRTKKLCNVPQQNFEVQFLPHPFPKILRCNSLDFGIRVAIGKRFGDAAFLFGVPLEFECLDF